MATDWLDLLPNLGVPGVLGVEPQKSAVSEACSGVPAGVLGVPPRCSAPPPTAVLRDWHTHLAALDSTRPPADHSTMFWQRACDDACWVYKNFASAAVRNGWSALDLFGVLPWDVRLGGLVPRLAGARDLKMDRERAVWSHFGRSDWTCRGAGDGLIASGIVPLWEFQPL